MIWKMKIQTDRQTPIIRSRYVLSDELYFQRLLQFVFLVPNLSTFAFNVLV